MKASNSTTRKISYKNTGIALITVAFIFLVTPTLIHMGDKAMAFIFPNKYTNENTLAIDAINIRVPVYVGKEDEALSKGLWNKFSDRTPVDHDDIVITGHRFNLTSANSRAFYNLDQVNVGDEIEFKYNDVMYRYNVDDIKVVSEDDIDIEVNLSQDRLIIYTCHPLWTSTSRLVVIASKH